MYLTSNLRSRLSRLSGDVGLPLLLGTLTTLGIAAGYRIFGFNVLQSDVGEYANWSHNLATQSYPSHLPGYPALIAIARAFTFNLIGDVLLAQTVCFLCWCAGVLIASRILQDSAPEIKAVGTLLYAIAPLVGVSYVAYPLADIPAHTLFLAAVLLAMRRRWWALSCVTAAGLLLHQAFYPFYFSLAMVCLFGRGMRLAHLLLSGVPFLLYYLWESVMRENLNWILAYHTKSHVGNRQGFALFNGIIGNLQNHTPVGIVKGCLLVLIFLCALCLAVHFVRRRNWLQLSLILPLLLYSAASNATICFLLVRLSKLLVFPGCLWAVENPNVVRVLRSRSCYWVVASCAILSQFAWAVYSVHYLTR